jgi:hypothetical protein
MRKIFPFLCLVLVGLLAWPLYHSWAEALTRAQWFQITEDEAFYAEVIQNLRKLHLYKSWSLGPFDPLITGGPAFLFPAFFLSNLTNLSSAVVGRLSSFLFHLGSLVLFVLINAKLWKEKYPGLFRPFFVMFLSIAGFFQLWRALPENNYFIFGFLAESSAVFYLFLFLYFFYKENRIGAGLAASLAYLAKPYMVYLPAALVLVSTTQDLRLRNFKGVFKTLAALAAPFLVWFLYMTYHLGIMETLAYWGRYPKAVGQFSGTDKKLAPFEAAWFHFTHFTQAMSPRAIVMTVIGCFYLFYLTLTRRKHLTLGVFMLLHLSWWFLMSPDVRPRYLIAVPIVALCYFIRLIIEKLDWKKFFETYTQRADRYLGVSFSAVLILLITFQVGKNWKNNWANFESCAFCRQLYILQEWERLVPPTDPNRPVWVATGTHETDRGLFYTAPFTGIHIEKKEDLSKIKKGDWAGVSDYSLGFFREWVTTKCKKLISPPGRNEGLWEC